MSSMWDEQYKAGHGRYFPSEELVRFLGRTYGPMPQKKASGLTAVEIGSGVGGNVWALAQWGFFVYGLELSQEAIRLGVAYAARQGFEHSKDYRQYCAPAPIRLPAQCAQLVLDIQTMQHLSKEAHQALYLEIFRVLHREGRFFSMHWVGHETSARHIFPAHPELAIWDDVLTVIALIEASGLRVTYREIVSKTYDIWLGRWLVIEAVKP